MEQHEWCLAAAQLTARESQILGLLSEGAPNGRAIATQLGISMNTVAFHLKSIYSKLGVNSRGAAVQATARCLGARRRAGIELTAPGRAACGCAVASAQPAVRLQPVLSCA